MLLSSNPTVARQMATIQPHDGMACARFTSFGNGVLRTGTNWLTFWITLTVSFVRLAIIGLLVVPGLAICFIALGMFFHIPRMLTAFALRPVMVVCLRHVAATQVKRRQKAYKNRKCLTTHLHMPESYPKEQGVLFCQGDCCNMCSLCTRLCPRILARTGANVCCKCNLLIQCIEKHQH